MITSLFQNPYSIIESMSGKVTAKSKPLEGTCFEISLPIINNQKYLDEEHMSKSI
ncbi:hypothetical protein ACOI1C_11705 [Bacillus sp. DJP31]|uniref:hypothetical protein n=1 Tax=Bacillus sp. DJP31 TaxID=3409789 RepID=UPI003BB51561